MSLLADNEGVAFLTFECDNIAGMIAGYVEPKDDEGIITTRCPKRGVVLERIVSAPFRESYIGKRLMDTASQFGEQDSL